MKHIFNVSINEILPGISEMVQQSFLYTSNVFTLYSTRIILLVFHFRCSKMPPSLTTEVYSSDMLDRAIANIEMIMSTGSLENEAKRYDELKLPH